MANNIKQLGVLIGATRTQKDISRAELARRTGIDAMELMRIEKGMAKKITDKKINKIFSELNIKVTISRF